MHSVRHSVRAFLKLSKTTSQLQMISSLESDVVTMKAMNAMAQQSFPHATLYVIATPIGNIGDISIRALHALSLADSVACEDTRNTGSLLAQYGLSKNLIAAHQHNEREVSERLIARLRQGERIALVSDAGTPGISDPGARIVDAVIEAGLRVLPMPGASACITALSASGLINDRFHFIGFLPAKSVQRNSVLESLRNESATMVFYEAPHRIVETIAALANHFDPTRQIVIARELTKLFEEIHRCHLGDAVNWLNEDRNHLKGEFVLLVEGAHHASDSQDAEAERILSILLEELPVSKAAALASRISGKKKNQLYERALQLKG